MKKEETRDHYAELTQRIVDRMEESKASGWVKPWVSCTEMPFNPVTGTKYRGVNAVTLMTSGFDDPRWFTFKGAMEFGAKAETPMCVKKGSKGFPVFKAMQVVVSDKADKPESDEPGQTRSFTRMVYAGTVFNGSQIEGLEPYQARENKVVDHRELELLAKALQARTGLKLEHSSQGRAYYSPSEHRIHMPNKELFRSTEAYYSTLTHEATHASGKELGRKMTGGFGSADYAYEELVAELGSYFLGASLGCGYDPSTHDQHAAYLDSWLQALKNDKNMIFKASAQASRACDFNMDHYNGFKMDLEAKMLQDRQRALSGARHAEPTVAPVMRM